MAPGAGVRGMDGGKDWGDGRREGSPGRVGAARYRDRWPSPAGSASRASAALRPATVVRETPSG